MQWMRPLVGAITVLLTAGTAGAQAIDLARAQAVADSAARAAAAAEQIPSVSIAVAQGDNPIFSRAYGLADVEMNTAATTATVYKLRSLTKQFTAAAVMRLVDQGRIRLDEPITTYLPDFPTQGRTVTVRHLLTHTSGLTTKSGSLSLGTALGRDGGNAQWHKLDLSYGEMLERFGSLPFEFEPGAKYEYNNFGYFLLGHVIARAAGMTYAEYVERELLRPLGLEHTWYCDDHRVIPKRAEGYEFYEGKLMNAPYTSIEAPGGAAGSLCGTVGDMVRWTQLLHDGKVVSPTSLTAMTARPTLTSGDSSWYGMGLYLPPVSASLGHRKIFHGGTRPGFGAYLSHYPDDRLTIAVLTNGGAGRDKAEEIERAVARAAFGQEPKHVPIEVKDLARYEGDYVLQIGARTLDVRVFVEGGQLRSQPAGQPVNTLVHQGDHTFVTAANPDIRIVFGAEPVRSATMTLHQGGRPVSGTRKP